MEQTIVRPAEGKLGIMVVGCGAVATTFMTGVFMARKGLAKPVGSMTQYDKIRVGRGADKKYLHYKDIVPLADLNDIVFGTWDVYPQNAYQAAMYAEVLKEKDINPVREELEKVVPMKAAFDKNYAKRLDGDNVKDCKTRWEMVEALRQDIRDFIRPCVRSVYNLVKICRNAVVGTRCFIECTHDFSSDFLDFRRRFTYSAGCFGKELLRISCILRHIAGKFRCGHFNVRQRIGKKRIGFQ